MKTPRFETPASMDWIGESIAETLRAAFAARGVLTLERDRTTEAYRRLQLRERTELTEASILKVGEVLDAEQVVHGTFSFVPAAGAPTSTSTFQGIAENPGARFRPPAPAAKRASSKKPARSRTWRRSNRTWPGGP